MPPAALFYGAPGIGKKRVALALVQWLFCRQAGTDDKRIEAKSHPDLQFIEPEGKTIKIETIRSCQEKLQRAPLEAPLKIVLIDSAESLTRQAANSLLKILEEPPRDTLFILITSSLFQILPTIRSRCRRLFFSPPPVDEMAETLAVSLNLPQAKLRDMLDDVDGSAGLVCELMGAEVADAVENLSRLFLGKPPSFSEASAVAQELTRKEIDIALLLEVQKKRLFRKMTASTCSKTLSLFNLAKIDRISEAQRDVERNVNKTLVLENLMMDLHSCPNFF